MCDHNLPAQFTFVDVFGIICSTKNMKYYIKKQKPTEKLTTCLILLVI